MWGKLSKTKINSESELQMLDRMALAFMVFFQARGRKFERMQEVECQVQLPGVSESPVRSWFGVANGSPKVDQLASIAVHVAPVHVNGSSDTDITAAPTYNNHSSVVPCTDDPIEKVHEDVRFGRFFVSPLRLAKGNCRTEAVAVGCSGVHVENSCRTLSYLCEFAIESGGQCGQGPLNRAPLSIGSCAGRGSMAHFVFAAETRRRCTHSPQ